MTILQDHDNIGSRIRQQFRDEIGSQAYDRWFASAAMNIEKREVRIAVSDRFTADWLDKRFRINLLQIANQITGQECQVQFCVETTAKTVDTTSTPTQFSTTTHATASVTPPVRKPKSSRYGASHLGQIRYDLDDYVVGKSNELAYFAACTLVDNEQPPFQSLFIHGNCGVGKTHLLQGICKRFVKKNPNANWRCVTAEQFTNEYIDAVRHKTLPQFRRKIRQLDLLAIDDVHFFSNKNATQNEFLHTFNEVVDLKGARVVLASDSQPHVLERFNESLINRFVSGMVTKIDEPDYEMRQQIIRKFSEKRGLTMLSSVVDSLVERCQGSVRDLEGWVTQLSAMQLVATHNQIDIGQPIGHAMLNQLFKDNTRGGLRKPVTFEAAMSSVSNLLDVPEKDMMSTSRHRRIVIARSLVMLLCRELTHLSFPDIAKKLKRANHSTIITAYKSIQKRIKDGEYIQIGDDNTEVKLSECVERLKLNIRRLL